MDRSDLKSFLGVVVPLLSFVSSTWPQTNALPSSALISANQTQRATLSGLGNLPLGIDWSLRAMLTLPVSGNSKILNAVTQPIMEKHRAMLLREIAERFMLDGNGTDQFKAHMIPLSERVAGFDVFGLKVSAGELEGYLRADRTHIYISLIVPPDFYSPMTNSISEFTSSEVAQMKEMDRQRYEISQVVPETLTPMSRPYSEHTFMPLATGDGLTRVQSSDPNAQQALQIVRRIVRDQTIPRLHWNIYDTTNGLYGDTVVAFLPRDPAAIQTLSPGLIARFFITKKGDFFVFCFSRGGEIFREDQFSPSPAQMRVTPDWLERE